MDPISTAIVIAIGTGFAKEAVTDSYKALKGALQKKFGSDSDLVEAIDKLEQKPDQEGRKLTVQAEVEAANITNDSEILNLAQDLMNKLKEKSGGEEIINQTQTNTVNNANVSGNFNFAPHQELKKN
jgi:predicted RND superfamily exporter protein